MDDFESAEQEMSDEATRAFLDDMRKQSIRAKRIANVINATAFAVLVLSSWVLIKKLREDSNGGNH